ncbi:N-acetylmuramoyl-L-alanine amidase [Nibricoccus sp. IMCC34717]|uniref:N-acetylmuramoyl-L-alanine amidase family protein n=1 Tax=Nibricoccus sp. IMCC34717 TaxID=3034021 RepID=UPI00384C596D
MRSLRFVSKNLIRRFLWAGVLFCVVSLEAGPQRPPTRPGPPDSIRRGPDRSAEYIDVADFARRFGLRLQWTKPGERLVLTAEGLRLELEADSREIEVGGARVFLGMPVRGARGGLRISRIDAEELLPPLVRPGYGEKRVPDGRVIVIDPGHGGPDQGTSNPRLRINEKTMTLDVSLRLKRVLESKGFRVILTRSDDRQLLPNKRADLQERAAIANRAGADLFVSVHFNAVPNDPRTKGAEVYAFTPQFQRSTDAWSRPSADDTEDEASPVNAHNHWNFLLAHKIHRRLLLQLRAEDRGQKLAHFGVLRKLQCPGILVEAGFLSNDAEARRIGTPEYRQQIAHAIAAGIQDYTATLDRLRSATKTP